MHRALPLFLTLVFLCSSSLGITTSNTSSTNETDRFLNHPDFLKEVPTSPGFDFANVFTGVGQSTTCSNDTSPTTTSICWGTMISPTVFLSATHLHPRVNNTIDFHDDDGNVIDTATVISGMPISSSGADTDLWIGVLDNPVDSSTTDGDAAVATYGISDLASSDNVIQVGISGTTPQFRVGQNRTIGFVVFTGTLPVNLSTFIGFDDDQFNGTTPVLDYESYYQGGDSGGPSFIESNGSLALVGIHSVTYQDDEDNPTTRGSADVHVNTYATQINAKVAAVPEPSAMLLLGMIGFFQAGRLWLRGRRKQ